MLSKLNASKNASTSICHRRHWKDFGIVYLQSSKSNVPEHSHC